MKIEFTALILIAQIFLCQFVFAQDNRGVRNLSVSKLPAKEKRWALIIGVDTYQKDISPLYGTVNDAKALRDVLIKYAGFTDERIILMTTDSTDSDLIPTRGNIIDQLDKLQRVVPEDGLILFSFSGHGVSIGSDAFIVPSDGRIYQNADLMRERAIDVLRIKRAIQDTKVKQVIMFLDACRNDPVRAKGDVDNNLTTAYAKGFSFETKNQNIEAYATLYATSFGDRAYEFLDKKTNKYRGYFSYAIEEGMKGSAANDKGEVTLAGLIRYIEDTVKERVRIDKNERQIPYPTTEGFRNSDLVVAVAERNTPITTTPNLVIQQPKPSPSPNTLSNQTNSTDNSKELSWINFKPTAQNLTKYDSIGILIEGLAQVYKSGKYGFINQDGEEVVPAKYGLVGNYSEGFAEINTELGTDGKSGFVDKFGKIAIALKYDDVQEFSEGFAPAFIFPKGWGFIDKEGRMVLPAKYGTASPFTDGLALVRQGKYGFINKKGVIVIPFKYHYAASFSEGLAYISNGKQVGFINKTGEIIIPMKYSEASSFSEGLANVCEGERSLNNFKCGFVDRTGKVIIPLKYNSAFSFENGLASVSVNNKYGFIDAKGQEIVSVKYESTWGAENELIPVKLNGKWGAVNRKGEEIIKTKYEDIWCRAFIDYGFLGIVLNGKKGFVDIYGNEYFDF